MVNPDPDSYIKLYAAKTMTERKRQQEVRTSPVAKRPRLSLKKKGSETTGPQHALHGTSSQQGN